MASKFKGTPCGEGALCQRAAQGMRGRTLVGGHIGQHGAIIFHIDHHCGPVIVLGGAAGHGRAPDIDILDGSVEIGATRHRRLERVEIAHQQVDASDAAKTSGSRVERHEHEVEAEALGLVDGHHADRPGGRFGFDLMGADVVAEGVWIA